MDISTEELIIKHRELMDTGGFMEKVFSVCGSDRCKNKNVQAEYIDNDMKLWCRPCQKDHPGKPYGISTFIGLTPEKVIEELGMKKMKTGMKDSIQKIENQIINHVKGKANELRKCIDDLKPTAYLEVINKLLSTKENICKKKPKDVTGADIAAVQKVCFDFDELVRTKDDSEDANKIKKVENSLLNFRNELIKQLDDVIDSLPVPDHTTRIIRGSNWNEVAEGLLDVDENIRTLRLHNEYPNSELFTGRFDAVIAELKPRAGKLEQVEFYFKRDFKLNEAEKQQLTELKKLGIKNVQFINCNRMLEIQGHKFDFKDAADSFIYQEKGRMPFSVVAI